MSKTIGREVTSDLALNAPTVSRLHAHIELRNDGQVAITDADSSNGTFLRRSESWIRVKKVLLCIGDRIRFGEHEVALESLTGVFGSQATVRLIARQFSLRKGKRKGVSTAQWADPSPILQKPRRNPTTGKIEEET